MKKLWSHVSQAKLPAGVGPRIRFYRLAAGRSLQDVAAACGCTKAYLSQIERLDLTGRLRAPLALSIARFLQVPVDAFFSQQSIGPIAEVDLEFMRRYCALPESEKKRFRRICLILAGEA